MNTTIKLKAIVFALTIFILSSCKKDDEVVTGTGSISLEFDHKVGTQALQFGTQSYTNANGDDFKVTTFKYYVSNINLNKADGSKVSVPESYYLINAADLTSALQSITNIPAGDYTGIEFTIGVDEARNFSGAQTGALDPAKGMFWSWNSGYIFVMFEGTSSKSTQTGGKLFYHVGGAKSPTNAVRKTTLIFPSVLKIRNNAIPELHLIVDVSSLFRGTTTINFANISGFHGGANGLLVADNYAASMFKVDHIHN